MSPADRLLDRLESVRQTGPDRWISKCPAHDDRTPSLAIRETNDGTVLLKCFAGDDAAEIVAAVGLELQDLFPDCLPGHRRKTERRPFPASDILKCLRPELSFLLICASDMAKGEALEDRDIERLRRCVSNVTDAMGAGGIHG